MLVLTRKENQRILFPNLGVTVQVLRIASNAVRIGVEAPENVTVLREEVAPQADLNNGPGDTRSQRHALRNRLNTANLALHLVQKQLDAGRFVEAEESLQRALTEFADLDRLVAGRSSQENSATPVAPPPARRALLVEDNAQERELLAAFLRLNGYQVDTAQDGLEAMRYLAINEQPQVVLLDMQMPRLNGYKTVSAIRRNPALNGMKLIAVSGADRNTLNVPAGRRGVDRWFSKPLDPARFISELSHELSDMRMPDYQPDSKKSAHEVRG